MSIERDNIIRTIRQALNVANAALDYSVPKSAYEEDHKGAKESVTTALSQLHLLTPIVLNDARWRKLLEQENIVYKFTDSSIDLANIQEYIDEKIRHGK